MTIGGMHAPVDIAVSGLRAQSVRMNVLAGNIANANTTRTTDGKVYRRREVVFRTLPDELAGVTSISVAADTTTGFKSLVMPGHPDADENGVVLMPNVELPTEMMYLVSATRAYQANAAVLKRYQDMVDTTIELLR